MSYQARSPGHSIFFYNPLAFPLVVTSSGTLNDRDFQLVNNIFSVLLAFKKLLQLMQRGHIDPGKLYLHMNGERGWT